MAKLRKWLRHAGNGSDSLATDMITRFATLENMKFKGITPMHHLMCMGSSATPVLWRRWA